MQETQIIWSPSTVRTLQQMLADRSSLSLSLSHPPLHSRESNCVALHDSCIDAALHSAQLEHLPAIQYIILSSVQRTIYAEIALVGQCGLRSSL
jgi:hypothetical protein